MKAIFASKLYKASKHKDKIKSALESPINVELVKQLKSYLDDEYKTSEYLEKPPEDDFIEVSEPSDSEGGEEIRPSESSGHGPSGGGGSHAGGLPPVGGEGGSGDESIMDRHGDELSDMENSLPPIEPSSKDVEEATQVKKTTVSASSHCCTIDTSFANVLKGTLDTREDTAGVRRIDVTPEELWIYYNDSINLNNIMEPVIDLINALGYTNLNFNRLARTENAIVFSISPVAQTIVSTGGAEDGQ